MHRARLSLPSGITELKGSEDQLTTKRFLIADTGSHSIRLLEFDSSPISSSKSQMITVAGVPNRSGHRDGASHAARFR